MGCAPAIDLARSDSSRPGERGRSLPHQRDPNASRPRTPVKVARGRVLITIPGDPSGARINNARRAGVVKRGKRKGKPMTYATKKAKGWRATAALFVRAAWSQRPAGFPTPREVEITTYWPRVRRSGPAKGEPLGDVDAPTKAVLDVLAAAGVVPDDAVFRRVVLVNAYDKVAPRIEVRLGNAADGGAVAGA